MSRLQERAVGHQPERHSSVWGWTAAGLALIVVLQPWIGGHLSDYSQRIILLAGINITLAVSLNVINGITGQFSIGHAGFMAIGAYVAAAMTVFGGTALETAAAGGALDPAHPPLNLWLREVGGQAPTAWMTARAQLWFAASLVVGGAAAAGAGYVVGQPTLRLRGDYLAIATLGFSEIVRVVLLNVQVLGGASGFTGTEPFNTVPPYTTFAGVYLVAVGCVLMVTCLKRSTHGRALLAVREDEIAAEAVGIDTARYKVLAFAFSSFFAGVAGGLYAHLILFIVPSPTVFGFMRSIEVIVMVVLGGSGSTTGAVLAACVMTGLPEWLRDFDQYRMVLYAEILLVLMLVRRQGLLGTREITSRDWYRLCHAVRGGLPRLRPGALAARWREAVAGRLAGLRRADGYLEWLALAVLALPLTDLACGALLRSPGGAISTFAGDLVSSLTALVPRILRSNPGFADVARQLQLPLRADIFLTVALLPLLLPWCHLARRLVAGDRAAARWVAAAAGLLAWQGGGLLAAGLGSPRAAAELALGLALLVMALPRSVGRRRHGSA